MSELTLIFLAIAGLALLAVAVVLSAVALSRLGVLTAARDTGTREAADLRTRLEVLAAQSADFERDMRQDFANARPEQGAVPGTASLLPAASFPPRSPSTRR